MITLTHLLEDIHGKIAALRAKTVARGATAGEAASAKAKADELEKKYNVKPSDKMERLRQQTAQSSYTGFDAKKWGQRAREAKHAARAGWTKAQWDAHLDAHERDERT